MAPLHAPSWPDTTCPLKLHTAAYPFPNNEQAHPTARPSSQAASPKWLEPVAARSCEDRPLWLAPD
eukprot:2103378-Alexandrium_andersonii.AAC.1